MNHVSFITLTGILSGQKESAENCTYVSSEGTTSHEVRTFKVFKRNSHWRLNTRCSWLLQYFKTVFQSISLIKNDLPHAPESHTKI